MEKINKHNEHEHNEHEHEHEHKKSEKSEKPRVLSNRSESFSESFSMSPNSKSERRAFSDTRLNNDRRVNNFYTMAQYRRRMDSDNRRYSRKIYSAGILPFYVKDNTTYFLLGKDPEARWSDFGGRSEGQDRGRWDTTAAREFYEETIGSVMNIPNMLARLQHRRNYIRVQGKTLNGSPYFMYVVKIPYSESYCTNFSSTLAFIQYARSFDKKFIEKSDIQWVSLDTIKASLEDQDNDDVINFPLRKVFKRTLVDNFEAITNFPTQFFESKYYPF